MTPPPRAASSWTPRSRAAVSGEPCSRERSAERAHCPRRDRDGDAGSPARESGRRGEGRRKRGGAGPPLTPAGRGTAPSPRPSRNPRATRGRERDPVFGARAALSLAGSTCALNRDFAFRRGKNGRGALRPGTPALTGVSTAGAPSTRWKAERTCRSPAHCGFTCPKLTSSLSWGGHLLPLPSWAGFGVLPLPRSAEASALGGKR